MRFVKLIIMEERGRKKKKGRKKEMIIIINTKRVNSFAPRRGRIVVFVSPLFKTHNRLSAVVLINCTREGEKKT